MSRYSVLALAFVVLCGAMRPASAIEVFDNGKLRFGNGSQASVNSNGNLEQPFYYDNNLSQWYKLTYSIYPLDNAIGIDGDGTNEWNTNGSIALNSALSNQTLDVSGFTVTSGSKGYGTIVSTGTVTINGKTLELKNTYTLGSDKSFIKIVTRITNTSGSSIGNIRVWVGTRDDWVGTTDGPTKVRGNLVNGVFTALTNSADRAAALKIYSGSTGVLFYSTSPKAHTAINNCCSFSNVYTQNPATSNIQMTNDGSYALFVRMDDLANGANEEFTWYYAAGELSSLDNIVNDVSNAAAQFTVTSSAGTGGAISPASVSVTQNATTQFTVTPNAGYSIASVQGCSGSLSGNTYTTGAINAACAVTASFTLNSYAVTAVAGTGGSISPGTVNVDHGNTTSFTVAPNAGYSLASVQGCNGNLSGTTYTTGAITAACTVTASFTLNTYAVTATAGGGGSVDLTNATVNYGSAGSFVITPDVGYSIDSVSGCNGSLNGNVYTTATVAANCAITISFTLTKPAFSPVSPADRDVNAAALLTALPESMAPRAFDYAGQELSVTQVGESKPLAPGRHVLTWRAVDSRGVVATVQQVLRIWPTVSAGADVELGYQQGNSTSFRIVLNGLSPEYPYTVNYTVSGSTTALDLQDGSVQFNNGETEKEVFFAVTGSPPPGSVDQDAFVEVAGDVNRGARHRLQIHLKAANVAPAVMLHASQGGTSAPSFAQNDGAVSIEADIRDPNSADTHIVQWESPSGVSASTNSGALVVQIASLAPGVYHFEAIVTDSGTPALSSRGTYDLVVTAQTPVLPANATAWSAHALPDVPEYTPSSRNVLPERAAELEHFLIESDPGVQLALGPHAVLQQEYKAEIPQGLSGMTIGADTVNNIGGYFDFIVSDLPAVGQSVNVVVPQRAPIPAHAVYRKFNRATQRWQNFVENGSNALASAPGAEGYCPPPGSDSFRPGLNAGDWCVRLTLSDGGPNDDDGQANGVVMDPGGVGALTQVVVSTSGKGGGGGALDPLLLLLGAALLIFKRSTREQSVWILLVAALAVSASASARDSWYVGAQLGPAHSDMRESDVNARLAGAGYDAQASFSKLSRSAWRAYAGYRFSRYAGLEAGYTDLGQVRTELQGNVTDIQQFLASADALHPHSAAGLELSLVGRYPLTPRLALTGRLGMLHWTSNYFAAEAGGESRRLREEGSDIVSGAGLQLALRRHLSLDAGWYRYRVDGEKIGFTSFGLAYRWY